MADKADEVKEFLIKQGQPFTIDDVAQRIEGEINEPFSAYIERKIADYRAQNKTSCANCSRTVLVNLRKFFKVDKTTGVIAYAQMTRERMQQFETYLITKPRKRKTADAKRRNTTSGYLSRLHLRYRQ